MTENFLGCLQVVGDNCLDEFEIFSFLLDPWLCLVFCYSKGNPVIHAVLKPNFYRLLLKFIFIFSIILKREWRIPARKKTIA